MDTSTKNNAISAKTATISGQNTTHTEGDPSLNAHSVFLYCHGLSMNAIAKILRASPSTILQWIRDFANQHAQPPEPQTDTVVLELDEMWHYLKKKSRNSGFGKLCVVIPENSSDGSVVIDKATLKKLIQRLEKWNVKVYYTDDWHPYRAVIPKDKLVQTKKETHRIERNNCRMRHWFGRFKRKSIIVSKSVEMVNVTVALFAKFRVNGDVLDILKIGQIEPNIII